VPNAPATPAGVVPSDIVVALGGAVSPAFAQARIEAAIAGAAQLQPGATVVVSGITIPNALHAGDSLEALATVAIGGGGAFADAAGTTAVHLHVETLAQLEPAFLFYSDDPETLHADGDGALYKNRVDVAKSARVYAYHVSDTPDRRLYLTLRATSIASRVQILGYAAGPAISYAYVGHVSTLQYLLERAAQESAVIDVVPATPYVQQLGYRALAPGELVAAIFDLRVLAGGPVDVAVIAVSGTGDPAAHLGDQEHAGDGHGRRGEFALQGLPPLALAYAAGDPEPSPFPIGDSPIPNLRAGGRPLGGDYGALRAVSLQLSNPSAMPQDVYFYERVVGGTATTTIWLTGDAQPVEMPCMRPGPNRYLVKAFTLAPDETRAVTGEYMTDGSSSFPLDFGLTPVPPSPPPGPYSPDTCNPRPQPSAPASIDPSPSPSAPP
jgi:hypothetical protein